MQSWFRCEKLVTWHWQWKNYNHWSITIPTTVMLFCYHKGKESTSSNNRNVFRIQCRASHFIPVIPIPFFNQSLIKKNHSSQACDKKNIQSDVRFEAFMAVRMMMFIWVLVQCRLVSRCQCFGETYCVHPQPSLCMWCCSSGFWRHVDSLVDANVSKKHTVSIFRANESTRRQNPEHHHHHKKWCWKVKVKLSLCLSTMPWSGGKALCIVNINTRWTASASHSSYTTPMERASSIHLIRGWWAPEPVWILCLFQELNPGPPAHSESLYLTELFQLILSVSAMVYAFSLVTYYDFTAGIHIIVL
jgi:hypothetical protein